MSSNLESALSIALYEEAGRLRDIRRRNPASDESLAYLAQSLENVADGVSRQMGMFEK